MQIELIDDLHLKITLKAPELAKYNTTPERLDYSNDETRRFMKALLYRASVQTGFTYLHCRLLIEVFPTSDNGCVIYFTNSGDTVPRYLRFKLKNNFLDYVFCFNGADDLLCCIEKIYSHKEIFSQSKLYYYKNKYYLALKTKLCDHRKSKALLSEFALCPCLQNIEYYNERAQIICEQNAIEQIGSKL